MALSTSSWTEFLRSAKGLASAGTIKESKDVSEDVAAYCGLANLPAIVPVPPPVKENNLTLSGFQKSSRELCVVWMIVNSLKKLK